MSRISFTLENWDLKYTESLSKHANNKKIAENLRNGFPHPYTINDAENYIKFCIEKDGQNQLCRVVSVDNQAVGSIGVFLKDNVYSKSAELGYWLSEYFWGNGIMKDAIVQMCELAFKNYDIVRIFAEPFSTNTASCRVLEKAGFECEGKLKKSIYKNGKFCDSYIYAFVK